MSLKNTLSLEIVKSDITCVFSMYLKGFLDDFFLKYEFYDFITYSV